MQYFIPGPPTPEFLAQPTNYLFADKNRTNTYVEDGTILCPFKTIEAVMAACVNPTDLNRYTISLCPGRWTLTSTLILKPFVDIIGITADATYIEFDGEVIQAPTSMNLGSANLVNILISCTSVDPAVWGIRIKHRGNLLLTNCTLFSATNGLLLEGDSVGILVTSGMLSTGDAIRAQGTSFVALQLSSTASGTPPAYDLAVETGASAQVDLVSNFQNDRIQIDGSLTYMFPGPLPDSRNLKNGDFILRMTNGVPAWEPNALRVFGESMTGLSSFALVFTPNNYGAVIPATPDSNGNTLLVGVSVDWTQLVSLSLTGNTMIIAPILIGLTGLTTLDLSNNVLPVSEIDSTLHQLVLNGVNGGTCNLSGQTPAAPPSNPVGLAYVATLTAPARGWTVTTD